MTDRTPLIAGNWKMNANHLEAIQIIQKLSYRLEAEDYCDQKLGSFEIVLERTMRMVAAGRQKLQLRSSRYDEGAAPEEQPQQLAPVPDGNGGFFDQDRS